MAIPSAVADLVTQRVAVEMVAGRCRKSMSALVKNSCEGFRRTYPQYEGEPDHTDLEYYSFLRDTKSVYPHPWEVPDWFRAGTLLAAAEE
eukprot:1171027-Amphidinium_carterae.1